MSGHQACYLLQMYADRGTEKFKIGRASNLLKRLGSAEYKNAFIILTCYVQNEVDCEKELISSFAKTFTRVKEDSEGSYGNEVFRGSLNQMMDLFWEICKKYRFLVSDSLLAIYEQVIGLR